MAILRVGLTADRVGPEPLEDVLRRRRETLSVLHGDLLESRDVAGLDVVVGKAGVGPRMAAFGVVLREGKVRSVEGDDDRCALLQLLARHAVGLWRDARARLPVRARVARRVRAYKIWDVLGRRTEAELSIGAGVLARPASAPASHRGHAHQRPAAFDAGWGEHFNLVSCADVRRRVAECGAPVPASVRLARERARPLERGLARATERRILEAAAPVMVAHVPRVPVQGGNSEYCRKQYGNRQAGGVTS